MTRQDLSDIFEDCTQRLADGETLNAVVRDYPEYADQLRRMLQSSQRLPSNNARSRLRELFNTGDKPKRKAHTLTSTALRPAWVLLSTAVLLLALGAIVLSTRTTQAQDTPDTAQTNCEPLVTRENPYAQQQPTTQQQNVRPESAGSSMEITSTASDAYAPTDVAAPVFDTDDSAASARAESLDMDAAEMEEAEVADAPAESDVALGMSAPESEPLPPSPSRSQQQSAPLRAGEIDDNATWEDYLVYRDDYLDTHRTNSVHEFEVSGRQVIRVVDSDGSPVLGACVQVTRGETLVAQSQTYATGQTLFFPNVQESTRYADTFEVTASKGAATTTVTLDRNTIGGVTTLTLDTQQATPPALDVVFLLDATGSMGDEIAQLQENILAISSQIDALPQDIDVRYGLVAYRDRGDAYITRQYPFTGDVQQFQADLNAVEASGGGDTPEALNRGLYETVHEMEWRGAGTDTIQLVFLVADAPPHLDYQQDVSYALSMQDALARGIKVHPIASSNLDDSGEYILRQIAQATMGKFLFLTYEDGTPGTPGDERPDLDVGDPEDEQGVGDYSVSQLDELVLRLITDEIAALQGNN